MNNALQIFDFIIMFGAGTGLIFLLRWFWWRINAWSEIAAMFSSGIISFIFVFMGGYPKEWPDYFRFPLIVAITTVIWLVATFVTQPESEETLRRFYKKIQPGGRGWKSVIDKAEKDGEDIVEKGAKWTLPGGILAMLAATVMVYCLLFGTGKMLFGETSISLILYGVAIIAAITLLRIWRKIGSEII